MDPISCDRNRRSPEFIAALRARFPVEKEIDRVLTRKLRRRAGPGFTPLSLEHLVRGVESLVRSEHADYRIGNFLFTEHDARISAWLDWELGRIGDPHQDLAWTTSRAFGGLAEDGRTFLTCGLMPESAFLESYERASGLKIDAKTLYWRKLCNAYSLVVMTVATSYRIALNGKTHQYVLLSWLIGIGGMMQEEIRSLLEQA